MKAFSRPSPGPVNGMRFSRPTRQVGSCIFWQGMVSMFPGSGEAGDGSFRRDRETGTCLGQTEKAHPGRQGRSGELFQHPLFRKGGYARSLFLGVREVAVRRLIWSLAPGSRVRETGRVGCVNEWSERTEVNSEHGVWEWEWEWEWEWRWVV